MRLNQLTPFEESFLIRIYKLGREDGILGDDVPSLDYRTRNHLLKDITNHIDNIPDSFNDDLLVECHTLGWNEQWEPLKNNDDILLKIKLWLVRKGILN